MLVREIKLRVNKSQESKLDYYLWHLTSLYNWTIRHIELNAKNKIYVSEFDINNNLSGHSKKLGIHSQVFQQTVKQACLAWNRCFKKLAKKPRLKGVSNKLNSFTFPQFKRTNITHNRIKLPSLGSFRFHSQKLPEGDIKQVRVFKRASGWYVQLTLDAAHLFKVNKTDKSIGIDTGFKDLAILSNGKRYSNQRNFIKEQTRLAQAQRGRDKKLVARLHERIKNRRKDYNHKVSKEIVQEFQNIAITNDNLRNQAKIFGKSVSDAGIAQLRRFIAYKSENHGRQCVLVDSKNTTKTCGNCGTLTGLTGLGMLAVREWECSACGAVHDRDINSACVILNLGFGTNLVPKRA